MLSIYLFIFFDLSSSTPPPPNPFSLIQLALGFAQATLGWILVGVHSISQKILSWYCEHWRSPKGETFVLYIKHGPVSSLLLTPFFIQPIYYTVKSRHRVSFFGSCSQVAFFVGDAAFFILPIYIYIYIYIYLTMCPSLSYEQCSTPTSGGALQ